MESWLRTSEKFTRTLSSISAILNRLPPCLGSMLSTMVTCAPRRTSSIDEVAPDEPESAGNQDLLIL